MKKITVLFVCLTIGSSSFAKLKTLVTETMVRVEVKKLVHLLEKKISEKKYQGPNENTSNIQYLHTICIGII